MRSSALTGTIRATRSNPEFNEVSAMKRMCILGLVLTVSLMSLCGSASAQVLTPSRTTVGNTASVTRPAECGTGGTHIARFDGVDCNSHRSTYYPTQWRYEWVSIPELEWRWTPWGWPFGTSAIAITWSARSSPLCARATNARHAIGHMRLCRHDTPMRTGHISANSPKSL